MKNNSEPTLKLGSLIPSRRCFCWILSGYLALGFLGLGLISTKAATQNPPDLMAYQGYLTDANGAVLAPTTPVNYEVVFKIYAASTGGTAIWAEKQTVTVDKGNFSILLGVGATVAGVNHNALSTVFIGGDASDRYIEMVPTINAVATTMSPRLHLVTSPYAMLAKTAIGLYNNDGSSIINLNASQLTSGTVADGRLSANVVLANKNNKFGGTQIFEIVGVSTDVYIQGNIALQGAASKIWTHEFIGRGTVPIGTIMAYFGDIAAIPAYWKVCDGGTYSGRLTPNLKGRFIVGAGGSGTGISTAAYNTTGGAIAVTLAIANLPDHEHSYFDAHFAENTSDTRGGATIITLNNNVKGSGDSDEDNGRVLGFNRNTHKTVGAATTPFSILPPYYALYYIMRVE